jgi:hypothetical protein
MEDAHGSSGTVQQDVAGRPAPIDVADPPRLMDALNPQNAGRTIRLAPGIYKIDKTLVVPDGATLQGRAGVMLFNDQGMPVQFESETTSTMITASPNLKGNLVTLGNQSSLRRLVLEGANNVREDDDGRGGNVVAVASRGPDDIVSATIDECELINKIEAAGATDGPTGGAILAYTRNPQRGLAPPPHVDAEVTVALTRSIVRMAQVHGAVVDGKAVIAMNFASRGKVTIRLRKNNIDGPLDVIGGLSRPDAVVGATTTIISHGNHYSPQPASGAEAWQIVGGSSSPVGGNANTDSNSASIWSKDDQIENFRVGIMAVGGRRLSSDGGTCSHNKARLELLHMTLATKGARPADFVFKGAESVDPGAPLLTADNLNIVHVLVQKTTGSGRRDNRYDNGGGANKLVFVGSPTAFTTSNPTIDPAPGAGFFEYPG